MSVAAFIATMRAQYSAARLSRTKLVDDHVDVEAGKLGEDFFGGWLEGHLTGIAACIEHFVFAGDALLELVEHLAEVDDRKERLDDGLLNEDVHEARIGDLDGVDLAAGVGVDQKLQHRAELSEARLVGNGEVGHQVALAARDELGALATDGDELGIAFDLVGDLAEEVGIERSAKTFVGGDNEDAASLDLALLEEGMLDRCAAELELLTDRVEQISEEERVRTTGNSGVLSALHLGRGNELHRTRDLPGILNRLDAAADVAKIGHLF